MPLQDVNLFDDHHVRAAWQRMGPEFIDLLDAIERTEDWTLDHLPDVTARLRHLGTALTIPERALRLGQADLDLLLFFLVYVSTRRALLVIRWLDEQGEGAGSLLLASLLAQDGRGLYVNVQDAMLASLLHQRMSVLANTPFFAQLLHPDLLRDTQRAIARYREQQKGHPHDEE